MKVIKDFIMRFPYNKSDKPESGGCLIGMNNPGVFLTPEDATRFLATLQDVKESIKPCTYGGLDEFEQLLEDAINMPQKLRSKTL